MLSDRPYLRDVSGRRAWSASTALIITNAVVYGLILIAPKSGWSFFWRVLGLLALDPADLMRGYIWQLLTFQFLHAGMFHLLINCAMLYMFGRPLEGTLGRISFLKLYLGSGVFGGLIQVIGAWLLPREFGFGPVVGASAGVFGLIAAFAWLNKDSSITMLLGFIIPVSMKAKYLLAVEVVLAVFGLLSPEKGIAHGAHLGGMAFGVAYAHFVVLGNTFRRALRFTGGRAHLRELVQTYASRRKRISHGSSSEDHDLPPEEFISKEVDPILDKISQYGIQSLTERERKILEMARTRMNRK